MSQHIFQFESELQNSSQEAAPSSPSLSPTVSEKLERFGCSALSGVEHLTLIVGKEGLALALVRHFGSIKALSRASIQQLLQFLPRWKAETLVAALSMSTIAESEHARSETFDRPESVYNAGADLKLFNQEVLRVFLLDTRQRLITMIDVTKGSLNESLAYPRDIFRPVIVHSAYSFILAHNLCVVPHKPTLRKTRGPDYNRRQTKFTSFSFAQRATSPLVEPMIAKSPNTNKNIARIGLIVAGSAPPIEGFKERLAELGWIEEQNVNFALRVAEGQIDRLPGFASEMVALKVDLIAVIGAITVRTVQKATSTIPIVFSVVVEPVGDGLAKDLQRPGGNATGVTTFDPHQAVTQLEFLKMVRPTLARVAILSDAAVSECLSNSNREAVQKLDLRPQIIRVRGPSPDYEAAFSAMDHERAQALLVLEEPINAACRKQIAELASVRRLPTIFAREQVDAGGLISYGTSLREAAKHMAVYADKILKGAKPGDLPIEAALRHELVINLRTARKLGMTVPLELLEKASQVID